jgi:hypothetical protein
MHCREVKRHLNNKIELSAELIDHIKNCAACTREINLAGRLDFLFQEAGNSGDREETPFAELKSRIMSLSASQQTEEISLMAKAKNEIEKHPGISLGIAFTSVVIAILLLVPVPYYKTVGYNLSYKSVQQAGFISQERLVNLVKALGYNNARVDVAQDVDGYEYRVANLPDQKSAREIAAALTEVSGSAGEAEVRPVIRKVSGNLYAQAKERVKIEINAEKKSDEEIRDQIREKLKELGYEPGAIKVKTDENGRRTITLSTNDTTGATLLDHDLWIDIEDNGDVEIGTLDGVEAAIKVDTKGKTKAEIKKEIIDQLKARGIENPEVEVQDSDEGGIEIKIQKDDDK